MNQTTITDPRIEAHGVLLSRDQDTMVLGLPGTDYQLHLQVADPLEAEAGSRITGTIHAKARRIDIVGTGGRYIEPVYGRPRRLQGVVIATDSDRCTIGVECGGCPFLCTPATDQKVVDFPVGSLVSFDVERGATFQPR